MKQINGLIINQGPSYFTCHLESLTDEFKSCIKKHLQSICHGVALAEKGLSGQTYQRTLKAFKSRYTPKTGNIKKGMIGELLAHVIIFELFDHFDVVSPYFNMEEKSQRKGFDLLLAETSGQNVWITEVKSGALNKTGCPDKSTSNFLKTAKSDLNRRLNESEMTFWQNAINSTNNSILDCKDYKDVIIKILDDELVASSDGKARSDDNNVILVSVLYSDINKSFDYKTVEKVCAAINEEAIFNQVFTLSIQKSTYENVATFLFEEELND
ncbi:Hachiman antiphage defense system protein HamA [uncultured Psychrosphaera sp.]|uniref:Hachiman antiphage defense system protein HamA n=1 Tax=uncultured Psychrosphaera sp. TaxID=1403522 RepID=UPI00260BB6E9|nr:Hachiman antiphage defense system protein HamA [uncultured Psychrosphaera sp.]